MIFVLEDMEERVYWLRKMFRDVDVRWYQEVDPFLDALGQEKPDLIILDHDLGPGSLTSKDARGKTGLDAARGLPEAMKTPVLIWSINPVGAADMLLELIRKGIPARHIAFLQSNHLEMSVMVASVLRKR